MNTTIFLIFIAIHIVFVKSACEISPDSTDSSCFTCGNTNGGSFNNNGDWSNGQPGSNDHACIGECTESSITFSVTGTPDSGSLSLGCCSTTSTGILDMSSSSRLEIRHGLYVCSQGIINMDSNTDNRIDVEAEMILAAGSQLNISPDNPNGNQRIDCKGGNGNLNFAGTLHLESGLEITRCDTIVTGLLHLDGPTTLNDRFEFRHRSDSTTTINNNGELRVSGNILFTTSTTISKTITVDNGGKMVFQSGSDSMWEADVDILAGGIVEIESSSLITLNSDADFNVKGGTLKFNGMIEGSSSSDDVWISMGTIYGNGISQGIVINAGDLILTATEVGFPVGPITIALTDSLTNPSPTSMTWGDLHLGAPFDLDLYIDGDTRSSIDIATFYTGSDLVTVNINIINPPSSGGTFSWKFIDSTAINGPTNGIVVLGTVPATGVCSDASISITDGDFFMTCNDPCDTLNCDDGNECTDDTCIVGVGCSNTPVAGTPACTSHPSSPDACYEGECIAGTCTDKYICVCMNDNDCVDSNTCTINERCNGGSCESDIVDCSGVVTTICTGAAVCVDGAGCSFTENTIGFSCNDSDDCTENDSCNINRLCSGTIIDSPTCLPPDEGNTESEGNTENEGNNTPGPNSALTLVGVGLGAAIMGGAVVLVVSRRSNDSNGSSNEKNIKGGKGGELVKADLLASERNGGGGNTGGGGKGGERGGGKGGGKGGGRRPSKGRAQNQQQRGGRRPSANRPTKKVPPKVSTRPIKDYRNTMMTDKTAISINSEMAPYFDEDDDFKLNP